MNLRKVISGFFVNTLLGLILYLYLYYSKIGDFPTFSNNFGRLLYLILISNLVGFSVATLNRIFSKIPFWRNNIGLRFIFGLISNYVIILVIIYFGVWIYFGISNQEIPLAKFLEENNEIKQRVYILV